MPAERPHAPGHLGAVLGDHGLVKCLRRGGRDRDQAMVGEQRAGPGRQHRHGVRPDPGRAADRVRRRRDVTAEEDHGLVDDRGDRLPGRREHAGVRRMAVQDRPYLRERLVAGGMQLILGRWDQPARTGRDGAGRDCARGDRLPGHRDHDQVPGAHVLVGHPGRGDHERPAVQPGRHVAAGPRREPVAEHAFRGGQHGRPGFFFLEHPPILASRPLPADVRAGPEPCETLCRVCCT